MIETPKLIQRFSGNAKRRWRELMYRRGLWEKEKKKVAAQHDRKIYEITIQIQDLVLKEMTRLENK